MRPMKALPDGMIRTTPEKDKTHFRAEDSAEPAFFIEGSVSSGTLTFTVVAVVGGHKGQWTGRQFFDALMAHFGSRRVKVISAIWSDARPELRTNFDIFNAETRRGASKEDAAFATKSGQWSSGYKNTMIESLETTPEGVPGGYEQVLVDFVKPRRVRQPRKQK